MLADSMGQKFRKNTVGNISLLCEGLKGYRLNLQQGALLGVDTVCQLGPQQELQLRTPTLGFSLQPEFFNHGNLRFLHGGLGLQRDQ